MKYAVNYLFFLIFNFPKFANCRINRHYKANFNGRRKKITQFY